MTLLWHESWSLSPNIAIPFDYLHFSMAKSKRACHLWTLFPILLRFLLTFSPSVFILGPRIHQEPYFQPTWVGISQDRRNLGFPLSGILFVAHAFFSPLNFQQQFSVRAAAALSLFEFFFDSLSTYRTHLVLKGSQSPLARGGWDISQVGRVAVHWALSL